jgi:two-component system, cell cycle sensor histidine kinase and response regulator CckA
MRKNPLWFLRMEDEVGGQNKTTMNQPISATRTDPRAETPIEQASNKNSKCLRILILEDVATDAELIERELHKANLSLSTRCVQTREDFLKALQDFVPDAILSDFSMPQFNAMEALHLLHEQPRDIPFILVTGSQSEEVAVDCMKLGADDYILKATLKRLPSALVNAVKKHENEREKFHALMALQRSEEHFRSLIENALDIILVIKPDGSLHYVSPSIRILGYKSEELAGKNFLSFVYADDEREVSEVLNNALNHPGQSATFEFLFRHNSGSFRVLEAIGKQIQIDGKNTGIVLNARDVTERKQAEVAIEKLASFPRLNPNPIFEMSANGRLTYFNRAAEEMARSIGKEKPSEILPDEINSIVQECLLTGKKNLRRETKVDGRILTWSFFPIIANQVVHCYATDITERLNLEAQLRQSQKMDSVGQLAAGVAHDFNNILTIIQGYTGLILERKDIDPELADPLKQVAVAAERAANLTRQLLMFSRKQVMQTQELDLNEVISNVTKFLRRILGEDITLHFDYSPNLPAISADSGMIEQIIMNLAVNTRDALPRGGQLSIGTSAIEITEAHVQANPEARLGNFVCLRFSDNGAGIPPEILPKIFEPFFTTKEVGKGTGLGLATVYGIVKQHQGWIEVLSKLGEGTTFRVYLPSVKGTAQPAGKSKPEKIEGGEERILVVEDEPELRALVCEILKDHGYEVIEAANGPEAIPVWQEQEGKIDLLLTDMVMPGNMTGRELAEKLKTQKPGLKVIYTSGYSADTIGKDFFFKRGLNFLQKPYHPLTLVKLVRDCLDS